ncbi:MAG: hypothetical protein JXR95_00095 [Deltaproteobacteria bacterium]|nr:hypothetical protein [Deltaproteobacteria bacterium]
MRDFFLKGILFYFILLFGCTEENSKNTGRTVPDKKPIRKNIPDCTKSTSTQFSYAPIKTMDFSILPKSLLGISYTENLNLHDRTIDRQRYKTVIYSEKRAAKERYFLAVLLWRTASTSSAAISVPPGSDAKREDIIEYRKKKLEIANYQKESLFHLEYLVKRKRVNPAILERYAYYTAVLHGSRAIPIFYRLITYRKVPDIRYYIADFTSLLLSDSRCDEARSVLKKGVPFKHRRKKYLLNYYTWLCDSKGFKKDSRKIWIEGCHKTSVDEAHIFLPLLARFFLLDQLNSTPVFPDLNSLIGKCPILKKSIFFSQFKFIIKRLQKLWNNKLLFSSGDQFTINPTKKESWKQLIPGITKLVNFISWYDDAISKIVLESSEGKVKILHPVFEKNSLIEAMFTKLLNSFRIKKDQCTSGKVTVIFPILR